MASGTGVGPTKGHVLVVDDDERMLRSACRNLKQLSFSVVPSANARDAEALLRQRQFSAVLSDLKLYRAVDKSTPLAAWIARVYRSTPVLVMTGERDVETVFRHLGTARIWGVLPKPFALQELDEALDNALEQGRLFDHQQEHEACSITTTLVRALTLRNARAGLHARRVGRWSWLLAARLGRPVDERGMYELGGTLHNVGLLVASDEVLSRRAPATQQDAEPPREHPQRGGELLSGIQCLAEARDAVLYHRERWDGGGYPSGLKGEQIPLAARVVALAEAYEAMTSEAPLGQALTHAQAVYEIAALAGARFDPAVVAAFAGCDEQTWLAARTDTGAAQGLRDRG